MCRPSRGWARARRPLGQSTPVRAHRPRWLPQAPPWGRQRLPAWPLPGLRFWGAFPSGGGTVSPLGPYSEDHPLPRPPQPGPLRGFWSKSGSCLASGEGRCVGLAQRPLVRPPGATVHLSWRASGPLRPSATLRHCGFFVPRLPQAISGCWATRSRRAQAALVCSRPGRIRVGERGNGAPGSLPPAWLWSPRSFCPLSPDSLRAEPLTVGEAILQLHGVWAPMVEAPGKGPGS